MAGQGTFLAESPLIDHGNTDHEDVEDPHDLSFSSNHILRASMVDNLVLSLDQFSNNGFDDVPYTPRTNSHDAGTRARKRGHTFSSSVSSEPEMPDVRPMPQHPETVPRLPGRNSVRYHKNMQRLPSIFGEDEDSVRSKVYDAQRAVQPGHPRRKKNISRGRKSNNSSASSSIDLGHLASLSGRLGGPGNRRSRSFDFGSGSRNVLGTQPAAASDGAPTPVVFAGPEAQNGLPGASSASPLVRRGSTKSSKSAYVKKARGPPTGTATMRNDSVPQLPSMKSVPSLSNTAVEQRTNLAMQHEPIVISKPGFFRRVFGSSKNPTATPEAHSHPPNTLTKQQPGRSTPIQDEAQFPSTPPGKIQRVRRSSTDVSVNKENQHPVVTKKSSAFFRRRKKSISSTVPPPLPLILSSELKAESDPQDGASPVSSLRAFMDPYLAENPPSSGHVRTNSMQGFYTPPLPPPTFTLQKEAGSRPRTGGHSRNQSHGSNRTLRSNARQVSTLRIPHQDSFLADSSSTEEPSKRSPLDGSIHSDQDRADVRKRGSMNDLKLEPTTSSSTVPSPSPSFDPRNATTRQDSWKSDKISPSSPIVAAPPVSASAEQIGKSSSRRRVAQLDVSRKGSKGSPYASASDVSEYKSAPSTPLIIETPDGEIAGSASSHKLPPSDSQFPLSDTNKRKARQLYDNADDELDSSSAAAWLGEGGVERERVRQAYMELFDWTDHNILEALRRLCDRIALRGETQQMDRIMDAFAQRWCECNTSHTFRSSGKNLLSFPPLLC